jgi:AcrR family transcriptional regulator
MNAATRTGAAETGAETASTEAVRTNKHGQALGRKGHQTRQRLMDATRRLLEDHSPVELTAVSIAKEAKTSSATFYIYFDDVRDIFLAISQTASEDLAEVVRILEESRNSTDTDLAHAQRVVDAFNDVWNRHRDILRFRNLEADRGDRAFLELRVGSAVRIIDCFVERIMGAYRKGKGPPRGEAYAEAAVLFAAMEGIAGTDPALGEEWKVGAAGLSAAMARLLARSFGARLSLAAMSNGGAGAGTTAEEPARKRPASSATKKPASARNGAASGTGDA